MRNKLFYLFGAAFLLCSIGMFTACSDDKDDPTTEIPGDDGGEDEKWVLSGDYAEGNTNVLKMVYNGEELTGKKVTVVADEKNEKATITLAGTEKDLGAMLSGLIDLKLTTSSPIPGETEIKLENVVLTPNADGTAYTFEGEDRNPTRTMTYKGTLKKEEMDIKITNDLAKQELAGTWELGPVATHFGGVNIFNASPLWVKWDTEVPLDPGPINGFTIPSYLSTDPNTLLSVMLWLGDQAFVQMMQLDFEVKIEQMIKNMLQSVTVEPNGGLYATYSYSTDINNPAWSSEMSHNLVRYYYGKEANQIYIETNVDYILGALGGLLSRTRAESRGLNETINPLIDALKPVFEKGIPCTYEFVEAGINDLNGEPTEPYLTINIDQTFTLDILTKLVNMLNDPTLNPLIMSLLDNDPTLAPYAENVRAVLKKLPFALKYQSYNKKKNEYSGTCEFIQVGLKFAIPAK